MILVVLGLEGLIYQTVWIMYFRIASKPSIGHKLLGVLVLASFTAVCIMLTWCELASCSIDCTGQQASY